jgi:cobalt-zinc-cadmium efflux system protein
MAHDHSHELGHTHGPASYDLAFAIGVALNLGFVVVEAVYGFAVHSLSLLADAGHNLSDVLGLLLAWGAIYLSRKPPSPRWTYGFRRTSILAALANAILLFVAVGGIAWEALRRFAQPEPVSGATVMVVAAIGIAVNGITAMLFMSGRKSDVNIEGAYLHMAADAGVSLGVLVAGAIIRWTAWSWVDPAVGLLISAAITWSTWRLLRKSVGLALDAVPSSIDPSAVKAYLCELAGVAAVHDLHIWAMSTTETALTVHLVKPELSDEDALLTQIAKELHDRFGIEHTTIQIERGTGVQCHLAPDHVV